MATRTYPQRHPHRHLCSISNMLRRASLFLLSIAPFPLLHVYDLIVHRALLAAIILTAGKQQRLADGSNRELPTTFVCITAALGLQVWQGTS